MDNELARKCPYISGMTGHRHVAAVNLSALVQQYDLFLAV
jgi:hypothetical protein